jgi:hypothetical protein
MEVNVGKRDSLLAQKAAYLARIGRFDAARKIVGELRSTYADGHSGALTVRIMIAEAMLHLYESFNPNALDRLRRAQFISQMMREKSLIALTSAWKSHLEFENSLFEEMFRSLRLARENSSEGDHSSQTRYCMVLCEVSMLSGNKDSGQYWFMKVRDHALKDGDQASIDGLLYNKAAFGLAWLRVEKCFGRLDREALQRLRFELTSSRNYQTLTQIKAMAEQVTLCEARLSILEEDYPSAIHQLNTVRGMGPFAEYNFSKEYIDLEIAFCHAKIGQIEQAALHFRSFEELNIQRFDIDEQLVGLWMISELSRIDVVFGDASKAEADFNSAAIIYNDHNAQLNAGLKGFAP